MTTLNPARLLLGGTLLAGSPRMRRGVQQSLAQHASRAALAGLEIAAPALGEEAALIGAALMAAEAADAL